MPLTGMSFSQPKPLRSHEIREDVKGSRMRKSARTRRHAKKFHGKSLRLGGGGRFAQLKAQMARKGVRNPGGAAAAAGRAKYGAARFAKMSAAGRRRHAGG
jgi:hypothetical protein